MSMGDSGTRDMSTRDMSTRDSSTRDSSARDVNEIGAHDAIALRRFGYSALT